MAYETFSSSGILVLVVAGGRTCSYTGGNWTAAVSGATGDVGAEVGGHFQHHLSVSEPVSLLVVHMCTPAP